jgi:nitronate monooxygenase
VHDFGGYVFCDVISVEHARKAVEAGVDGLILVCSAAGGHTGDYSAFAFVQEVREFWGGPLIVGGAISNARSIQALLTLGADFAYMGTRFISCPESQVSDENREMLVRAGMADIVTTAAVSGVRANWMRESLEKVGFDFDQIDAKAKVDFSNIQGEGKAWKHTWGAGHGVGKTHSIQTVEQVVNELKAEWNEVRSEQVESLLYWADKD